MAQSCPMPFDPQITTPPSGGFGAWVSAYDDRRISPAEALLLLRYREPLSGHVLRAGPGAGRFTEYLAELAGELTAPRGGTRHGRGLPAPRAVGHGAASATWRSLDGGGRRVAGGRGRNLQRARRARRPGAPGRCWPSCIAFSLGGLLLFSSHNRDGRVRPPWHLHDWRRAALRRRRRDPVPAGSATTAVCGGWRWDTGDYALRNDEAHDFTMVLYSIGAPAQQRQLAEAGFTLEVCMNDDGDAVTVGVGDERRALPALRGAQRGVGLTRSPTSTKR